MMSALRSRSIREDGFTLLEVIVVVAIIGILAAIAVPVYTNQLQGGYVSALQSDISQTSINLSEYYQQNNQWPNDADLGNAQRANPTTAEQYFDKNIKVVTSGSGNTIKAYFYEATVAGNQVNADTTDSTITDMACIQGTNTTKIRDTKRQIWSYYFTPSGAVTGGSLGSNKNTSTRLGPCNDHGINNASSATVIEDEGLVADLGQGVAGWTLTQTLN